MPDIALDQLQAVLDLKETQRRVAAVDFELSLRALGPVPTALRSVDGNDAPSFFREAVLDLNDLADRASDQMRRLMHEASNCTPRPNQPDPMALLVAFAAFALWHESWRNEDDNIARVADSTGIEPRALRWAVRCARLTSRRLRDHYPEAHAMYIEAFGAVVRTLTKGFAGRDGRLKIAHKAAGATRSVEDLLD